MSFGNALWLWLLATLVIPIAIHLWQRKSGKPRLLGTFRFLPDQTFAKAQKIELHEVPLLIIRMLIIGLLTFLLADFFILDEKPEVDAVILTETDHTDWMQQYREGNLEIDIPANLVEEAGWWNVVEQIDADHQPGVIFVNGKLTQNRFTGIRPVISADIEWVGSIDETQKASTVWQSTTGNYSVLIQRTDSLGVHHSIEQISNPEILDNSTAIVFDDTVSFAGSLRMEINPNIPNEIQAGLEYVAEYWNADIEFSEQPEQTLCLVMAGGQQYVLRRIGDSNGLNGIIKARSQTGVEIAISNLDTTSVSGKKVLLQTHENSIPVLWFSDEQTLRVNGNTDPHLSSWFYAGAVHQLIQHSLDVNQFLNPKMPEDQRKIRQGRHQFAGIAERKSVRSWLLILLLIFWAAERFLAPRRRM